VSQTAGPETVLAGEAKVPYALLGYATDYANGVKPDESTPVEELVRLVGASTDAFARTLAEAVPRIGATPEPIGTHFSWP
jgi:5'-methylthioadenosine phosphorylase